MTKELVINTTSHETRVALLENGHIAELYIERSRERGIVGNIYQGKVIRVLPGMQAAFVDIGLEKAAFLYVADVLDEMEAVEQFVEGASQHAKPSEGGGRGARPCRPSRTCCRRGRRSWSRWPRSRSAPRGRASPPTSPFPAATWSTCRPSTTSASPGASRTRRRRTRLREPGRGDPARRGPASSSAPPPKARARRTCAPTWSSWSASGRRSPGAGRTAAPRR